MSKFSWTLKNMSDRGWANPTRTFARDTLQIYAVCRTKSRFMSTATSYGRVMIRLMSDFFGRENLLISSASTRTTSERGNSERGVDRVLLWTMVRWTLLRRSRYLRMAVPASIALSYPTGSTISAFCAPRKNWVMGWTVSTFDQNWRRANWSPRDVRVLSSIEISTIFPIS